MTSPARRAIASQIFVLLVLAACGPATPKGPQLPPELEKPYPWRLAPKITEVGPAAYFDWFAHRAVDEDTRAFVRAHGPALAEVRLGLEPALKEIAGARIMTRATGPGRGQLKSPASVEDKILRLWKGSVAAWEEGRSGFFSKGTSLGEARQQVFTARPGDPHALTDVAGLRVVVPSLATLKRVVAERGAAWKGRIIKHKDYVGKDHRGDGYRSVHFVVKARDRAVEVQLRTTRMHRWAAWEHELVYKGRFRGNETVKAYARAVAKRLHSQDLGTCEAPCPLPNCPAILDAASSCYADPTQ